MKTVKAFLGTAAALVVAAAVSGPANAIVITYEGFISYVGDNGDSSFADIDEALAENKAKLVNSGDLDSADVIEEIGKKDVGGSWDGVVFENDPILSFSCDPDNNACTSFTIDFDTTVENVGGVTISDWELVKIAIKIGNTGPEDNDLSGHGIFLVEDGDLDGTPITFDSSLIAAFQNDVGLQTTISNIHFFGVGDGAPVPEPGTLALFGIGLVGLGAMARRRRRAA